MIKNILLGLAISSFSIAYSQNATLSGKITNPTGEKVFVFERKIENNRMTIKYLDSATLSVDGAFVLKPTIDKTTKAVFSDGNESMDLLLSPNDNMQLTLNTKYFDETMRYTGVGAEKNNAIVALYLIEEVSQQNIFSKLDDDEPDTSAMFSAYDNFAKNFISLIEDYNAALPDFKAYGENRINEVKAQGDDAKDYVRSDLAFKKTIKALVGKPAIDFEGVDLKGKKIKLSDFKGKITVVDFWATWCGPCKAEFPAYKALEGKFGKDVNFVSVGVYCDEKAWKKMATDEGFSHNIFLSKEAEKQIAAYKVDFIPRYLVLDENFVVIDALAPRPSSGELEKYWVK
jgi:thiol-disulfide isomerase/thioredoxin